MFRSSRIKFLNRSGFSLAEVIIVLGVMSVVSAGLMTVLGDTMKSQKSLTLNDDLRNSMVEVKSNLDKPNICALNLANFTGLSFDRTQLGNLSAPIKFGISKVVSKAGGTSILESGKTLPGRKNTQVNMTVENLREVIANQVYIADYAFALDKDVAGTKSVSGPSDIVRKLTMVLQTVNAGNIQTIVGCTVSDSSALSAQDLDNLKQQVCASMAGSYSGGQCTLPVTETAKATVCGSMGGWYANGQCNLPASPAVTAAVKADMCATFGGSYVNGRCNLPVPAAPPPPPQPRSVASVSNYRCGYVTITYTDGSVQDVFVSACSNDNGGG